MVLFPPSNSRTIIGVCFLAIALGAILRFEQVVFRDTFRGIVEIVFNGEARQVLPGITVAELIEQLGFTPRFVAVEVNLELVPRGRHAEHRLSAGDRLEVVTLVGGG